MSVVFAMGASGDNWDNSAPFNMRSAPDFTSCMVADGVFGEFGLGPCDGQTWPALGLGTLEWKPITSEKESSRRASGDEIVLGAKILFSA